MILSSLPMHACTASLGAFRRAPGCRSMFGGSTAAPPPGTLVRPLAIRPGVAGEKREHQGKNPKPPKPPTHFLSLPLHESTAIRGAFEAVQASLAAHSPLLAKACIDPASAHLTLGVMALYTPEEIAAAVQALADLGPVLQDAELLAQLELTFSGLGHFNNRVLFLKLHNGQQAEGQHRDGPDRGGIHGNVTRLWPAPAMPGSITSASGGSTAPVEEQDFTSSTMSAAIDPPAAPGTNCEGASSSNGNGSSSSDGQRDDGGRGRLMALASLVRAHFAERQLLQEADKDVEPHVTIAKIRHGSRRRWKHQRGGEGRKDGPTCGEGSRSHGAEGGGREEDDAAPDTHASDEQQQPAAMKRIPDEAYATHMGISCGEPLAVSELHLCAINGRRRGSYYPILASLSLVPSAAMGMGGATTGDGLRAAALEAGAPEAAARQETVK